MTNALTRLLARTTDIRPGEGPALFFSGLYYFLLLCAYYIIRPIRDDMGAAGGVENLAWLFSGTLIGMLLLQPLYGALVSKLPRRRFVPLVYRFFILNLIGFFLLFRLVEGNSEVWAGRIFFIWVSVFNLFVVTVFWSFVNDIFRPSQSRRLFGIVAVGGTAGALSGSIITSSLASLFGPVALLLVSAALLEVAARVSAYLGHSEEKLALAGMLDEATARGETDTQTASDNRQAEAAAVAASKENEIIGGGILEGIAHVLKSPYLLGIAGLMLMFTIVSTFLYFQQIAIVNEVFGDDRVGRTQLFANRDLITNALTLFLQIFMTGRILRWFGVGIALAFLPVVSFIGFGILAVAPVLAVVIVFDVLRRTSNFAIQRPAREALYTVLARTDKYKAKNFNDTVVYRVGDQLGAWSYTAISAFGFSLSALALTMLPVSIVWFSIALWLGARYRQS
ncbi:MAG: MFS transporter [Pseudomonadales bacterium]|nr:MFS transporter [Pseudomonadales bacterium]